MVQIWSRRTPEYGFNETLVIHRVAPHPSGVVDASHNEFGARVTRQKKEAHLTQSVLKVVSQKPIPTQICQLILYISNSKGQVDEFVGDLTSAKRL